MNNPLFEIEAYVSYNNLLFELNEEAILESYKSEDEHKTWDPSATPIN